MPIFRFRTPPHDADPEPLASRRTAEAWFATLPAVDTIGRHQIVARAIESACRAHGEPPFELVGAIEFLDAELAADRGRLITQYVAHAEGSAVLANRIWQAAYDICQGFIVAYRCLVDRALGAPLDARWKGAMPRLVARLVHFYGTDAKLRALRCEPWIPAKWVELHGLYRRAIELGIHRAPLDAEPRAPGAPPMTIEREFIAVLLTHLVGTGTLVPREIDWAAAEVRAWAAPLELDDEPTGRTGFVVDLAGKRGLVRRTAGDACAMPRYLDTGPLVQQLERGIAALRRLSAADAADAAGAGTQDRERIAILERLRPALAPEVRREVPRTPRTTAGAPAAVRIGLARICAELSPSDIRNAAIEAATGAAFRPADAAADGADPPAAGAGAPLERPRWRVEDRSASGLRIVAPATPAPGLAPGTLVAVREPDEGGWVLGVVRRVARPTADKFEAGVAVLAARALAVALHAKRQARKEMGFIVDGVDVSTIGERFDGLYLPPSSRGEHPVAAKTLVIPSGEYAEGRNVILITPRTVYTVAVREPLERHPDWTWVTIDIVDRTARD
jgi:cyclic-di-GMP-binding protein